jgi:hypothetical protein
LQIAIIGLSIDAFSRSIMPYDGNGNFVETCGEMCISNRFANDSSNGLAKVEEAPPVLCGFGCGG